MSKNVSAACRKCKQKFHHSENESPKSLFCPRSFCLRVWSYDENSDLENFNNFVQKFQLFHLALFYGLVCWLTLDLYKTQIKDPRKVSKAAWFARFFRCSSFSSSSIECTLQKLKFILLKHNVGRVIKKALIKSAKMMSDAFEYFLKNILSLSVANEKIYCIIVQLSEKCRFQRHLQFSGNRSSFINLRTKKYTTKKFELFILHIQSFKTNPCLIVK